MKRAILALALLVAACGDSSSPAGPVLPPAPSYPNMTGAWAGTRTSVSTNTVLGFPASSTAVCNEAWSITSQTGSAFSGIFQQTKQTDQQKCAADTGSIAGTITTAGALAITFTGTATNFCTLVSGSAAWTGVLSGGTVTLQRGSNEYRCSVPGGTVPISQTDSTFMHH